MSNSIVSSALSPPPGMAIQTTKLANNLQSMVQAVSMLQRTVQIVANSPATAQKQLAPLMAQFITPLLQMAKIAETNLSQVTGLMQGFINTVNQTASQAQFAPSMMLPKLLRANFNSLEIGATAIQSAALLASQMLTNFQNSANNTEAALNSYKQTLLQEDASLQQKVQSLEQQIHDMTSGNCCQQIGHAFQMLFGHLREELQQTEAEIRQDEYVLMLNNNALSGLSQMLSSLGEISSVAAALEISWHSLADSISGLQQDITTLLADTSPTVIASDLSYVQSDWQAIAATLSKVQ